MSNGESVSREDFVRSMIFQFGEEAVRELASRQPHPFVLTKVNNSVHDPLAVNKPEIAEAYRAQARNYLTNSGYPASLSGRIIQSVEAYVREGVISADQA